MSRAGQVITPQSPVRIPSPQLEPHGSETSRPRGFVLRSRRDGRVIPRNRKGLRRFRRRWGSLSRRRARPDLFTRSASTPHFWPKLSAVSLSRAAWVKRCWLRSFGRNLPGLASEKMKLLRSKWGCVSLSGTLARETNVHVSGAAGAEPSANHLPHFP